MARSVTTIYNTAVAQYVANAQAAGITTVNPAGWSMYNYQRLIFWTMAFCQSILEQIMDAFTADVQSLQNVLPPQTPAWFQNQLLNVFEYDTIAVPIVQMNETTNFVPYYPNANPNFNIVKYCSVTPGPFLGTTIIKVAGAGPSQISGPAFSAIESFVDTIGVPGLTYSVESLLPDRLFLQLDVYYVGLYSVVIQANVIAAIQAYLGGIPFNGYVTLSDLELAIKGVAGVTDIVFVKVQARAQATIVGSGTNLVLAKTVVQRNWSTVAGYIIPEDTSGAYWQLTDPRSATTGAPLNLNLIPQ